MTQVSLQRTLRYTTILCGMVAFSFTPAFANPVGGSVAGGSASISQNGNTLTVQQTSNKAIINWQGFDIASDETTQFVQPSSSSIALNRISENKPSEIDGTLTANGNVILINPNGVVFGATSHVDVNSLVVSSSDVNDNDFMTNATPAFNQPGSATAQIVANGRITVAQAGLVGLVAPHVENNGTITATLGTVMLASGDTFTLDLAGDGLTNIAVTGALQQQLAQNSGVIRAQGGKIEITAAAARDVVDSLVANSGTLEADSFQQQGGTIILSATGGTVTNTGTIEARGLAPFQSGGSVTVAANNIHQDGTINVDGQAKGGSVAIAFTGGYDDNAASLISDNGVTGTGGAISIQGGSDTATLDAFGTYKAVSAMGGGGQISLAAGGYVSLHGAQLDASGATGGGVISIGYDATGARNTGDVTIDAQSKLLANATNNGNGGDIRIGANNAVNVSGALSAQGGPNGGNGGNINISFGNLYTDSASALLTVASPAGQSGGIFIEGDDNASLTASGTYISDGQTTGGTISLLAGQDIFLLGALLRSEGPLGGGTILIGGDFEGDDDVRRSQYTFIDGNTRILADATGDGDGGNVAVWSDDYTDFEGFISARGGPNGGNGGYVETSGEITLTIGDGALVNTIAPGGNAGTWLLDPQDFTIASSGSDMTGATLSSNLSSGNVTILSSSGGTSGTGSIYVNDTVNWGAFALTLTAADNIVVSAAMTVTGAGALTLNTATANGSDSAVTGGALSMAMASGGGFSGVINMASGTSLTIGSNGTSHAYTIINSLGAAGSTTGTDLQGMNGNLSGYYALGSDIDASATSSWNSGAGFTPVSSGPPRNTFIGQFEGLGHVISNLTISLPASADFIGLFGDIDTAAKINDVGLSGGTVSGSGYVGSLAGENDGTVSNSYSTASVGGGSNYIGGLVGYNTGTLSNSYSTGTVNGTGSGSYIGGVVGENTGTISDSYATGAVGGATGFSFGGLVGENDGTISNDYATGAVSGGGNVDIGGLVGANTSGTISNSYATGSVTGSYADGLVGNNKGSVTNSFWDTQTSGQSSSAGGTGETTLGMQGIVTFRDAGWSISGIASSNYTWYINGGYPVLQAIGADMPGGGGATNEGTVTITALGQTVTYGTAPNTSGVLNTTYSCTGAGCSFISGNAAISIILSPTAGGVTSSGSGNYNAGTWTNDIATALGSLAWQSGYTGTFSYTPATLIVNQKALTISGLSASNRTYDGLAAAVLTGTPSITAGGVIGGDTVLLSGTATAGTFASANVGSGISVTPTLGSLSLTGGGSTDGANYTISGPVSALTANITTAALTITASDQAQTYGGIALGTSDFTSSGLQDGETIGSVTLSPVDINGLGTSGSGNLNVGAYEILGSNARGGTFTASNYSIAYATTGRLTVNQKALTGGGLTAGNKAYDGTTADTLGGVAALLGKIIGDNVTIGGTASGAFADANVGNGKAVTVSGNTISGADAGDYSFTQQAGLTANITQAALTITASDQTQTYGFGGTSAALGTTNFSVTGGSLASGQNVTAVTLSTNDTTSTSGHYLAGAYNLTPSAATGTGGFNTTNYAITYATDTNGLVVAQKDVTISGLVASGKTYDGTTAATLTGTPTLSGTVGGDAVSLSGTATSGTFASANAGSGISVTPILSGLSLSGADETNYVITGPASALSATITAAALTITASNQNLTYGTSLGDSDFTSSGLVGGQTIGGVTLTSNDSTSGSGNYNAGSGYTITPSAATGGTFSAGNYSITYDTGTLNITPKTLTVSGVSGTDKTYDSATSDPLTGTAALSGLIANDNVTLGGSGVGTLASVNAGPEAVTVSGYSVSGTDAGDYSFSQPTVPNVTVTSASNALVLPSSVITFPVAPPNTNNSNNGSPATVINLPATPPNTINHTGESSPPSASPSSPPSPSTSPSPPPSPSTSTSSPGNPQVAGSPPPKTSTPTGIDIISRLMGAANYKTAIDNGMPTPFQPDIPQIQAVMERSRLFLSLQSQLDTLEAPVSKESQRVRHIVIPGVVAFSVLSIGYMLLFSRALYAMLASIGLASVRQRLDPAALVEHWESENRERSVTDEQDKRIEKGMFG